MPNRNNERPDQVIARIVRDQPLSFKEMMFEASKQQDSIAVWLVGMSTAAIALIISQFGKFSPALYPSLKWSVAFLTATIIAALLFRIFNLRLQERDRIDLMAIEGWLAGYSEPSSGKVPIELPEDSSAGYIALSLYHLLGLDMTPDYFEYIKTTNDVEYWGNEYEKTAELHRRLKESEHEMIKEMIEDFYAFMAGLEGFPPQKYDQIAKRDNSEGIRKRRIRKICRLSYILMCVSFAISVLFISTGFIKTDLQANQPSSTTNQKVIFPAKQVQPKQVDRPN